ncbi:MAG: tRNA lysidine(34) synthetase TilS [Lachnospiraceae bacterium]|nr:tRNA lysidine(34) synthetase TilS [Lachnospiraceae bacterium]
MLRKILGTIEREGLIKADDLVVVGVSGGADSICLLLTLLALKRQLKIQVAAVHVHHGIRGPEADRDEAFVRDVCKSRGVRLQVYRRNVPELAKRWRVSLEEAGRRVRYDCFREMMKEISGDRLAVAHNRDDNAETVLFHLFRGSGLKGLSGINYQTPLMQLGAPVSEAGPAWEAGNVPDESFGEQGSGAMLIRPLLDVSRKEIEKYLQERGISFCQDSTNASSEYSRNRIRLNILPEARKINEEAAANIVRAARMLKETECFLKEQAKTWLKERAQTEEAEIRLPGAELFAAGEPLSGLILRAAFEQLAGSLKDITKRHTDAVLELLGKGTGRRISLPGGVTARNEYGTVILSGRKSRTFLEQAETEGEEKFLHLTQEWREETLFEWRFRYRIFRREPGEKIPENRYTKWFACDKIKDNLSLRGRRPGDWFQAFADGGRQTVKTYMINEKIPPDRRGQIPLLTEGSHVLWIVGGRISEAYKVTEKCEWVLEILVSRA